MDTFVCELQKDGKEKVEVPTNYFFISTGVT